MDTFRTRSMFPLLSPPVGFTLKAGQALKSVVFQATRTHLCIIARDYVDVSSGHVRG
jgi:hypothetical protein